MKNFLLAIAMTVCSMGCGATPYESIYTSPLLSACSDFQQWHRQIDEYLCYGFQNLELRKKLPAYLERIFGAEEGKELADMILNDEAWKETIEELNSKINDGTAPLSERVVQQKYLKAILSERAFGIAAARLPRSADYPDKVKEACSQTQSEENKCLEAILKSDTEAMSATYRTLLQKQSSPSGLIGSQNAWRHDMETTCEFGSALGYSTRSAELQCQDNWIRLRNYELEEELKAADIGRQ